MMQIKWCWLQAYPTREEAIIKTFQISKQQLKKYSIEKKWLMQTCQKGDECSLPIDLINRYSISAGYTGPVVKLLKEDDLFIVLSKPPGIHMHPLKTQETNNLLSFLVDQKKYAALEVNQSAWDRGLLYRLDFETSGLVILCKKESLYFKMRKNFHHVVTMKMYLALVQGDSPESDHWVDELESYGPNGHKMRRATGEESFLAELEFQKLHYDQEKDQSLVLIKLKTGIRHQIRVQFMLHGHPLIGDELYGGRKHHRLMLHCYRYEIEIDQSRRSWVDEPDESFGNFLDLNSRL
jgi:23S rRNA pseudouridine1911/1915/1917 synthase